MPERLSKESIRALAGANGLTIPEDRLEAVLKTYQGFLDLLERLNAFPIDNGVEPMTTSSLVGEISDSGARPR